MVWPAWATSLGSVSRVRRSAADPSTLVVISLLPYVTLCSGERVGRFRIRALTVSFASGGHKKLHASLTRSSETPKNSPSQFRA